ncbi:hypothetical protein SELMODRAFT_411097 [Selaginella moellendorffii]|uniref:Pentatricopeptide repeat-containing protein n=1 Tax=Selaginella moellendorffii TaxID=88036 RepID=D8RGK4_SELML|nr:hypothetical protein SELMODRAFT_411097 [Selaginella moellendorffii]
MANIEEKGVCGGFNRITEGELRALLGACTPSLVVAAWELMELTSSVIVVREQIRGANPICDTLFVDHKGGKIRSCRLGCLGNHQEENLLMKCPEEMWSGAQTLLQSSNHFADDDLAKRHRAKNHRNLPAWNAIIAAYAQFRNGVDSVALLHAMLLEGSSSGSFLLIARARRREPLDLPGDGWPRKLLTIFDRMPRWGSSIILRC